MEDRPLATRVILVRHGESSYNLERRVQGHCDESTLTESGRQSARQVGEALGGLVFDAIYTSPLQRAKDTAEIVRSCLEENSAPLYRDRGGLPPLQTTDDLKEVNLALWEGMPFTEVEAKYPDEYRCWMERPHELRMVLERPEGTVELAPIPALYDQARRFWEAVLPNHAGQAILVVAHSGILRALISTAIDLDPSLYQSLHQTNCGISVLNFAGGLGQAVQIESMNLTSHLGDPLPRRRHGHQGPRILLVRHGETEWNRQTRFQGQIDVPLNDNGRAQAQKAAEFLKSVPLQRAVSSSMQRPKETAEIILQHHPHLSLELRDALQEIGHGLWEGKLETEIEALYPGMLKQWQQAPETVQMPEGESLAQVWERAIADWQKVVETSVADANGEYPTVLVVAHDAINKAILCHVLGLDASHFWNFRQGNGAVSVIDYPAGANGQPVLQAMNITSHLSGGVLDKTAVGAL